MKIFKKFARTGAYCLTVALACTAATAAPPTVSALNTFDRSAIKVQMKQAVERKIKQVVSAQFKPSNELRVKMCQQQSNTLANTLAQCLTTNSDPVNPPPGSPLDSFNKLTNAQLVQKCPGSLQQCLDKVLDEHVAWCKANMCKSQSEALTAKQSECSKLEAAILAQERSQPPTLKKNTPPCPTLYQDYLKAREAANNFTCNAITCWSNGIPFDNPEFDALKKLTDRGCI
ncbi:MAG: hypothetical protein WCK54_14125 [Desulfuromonadales bacterium]